MARLLVNPGTLSEWVIPLKVGVNTLGRDARCDFQIEHGSVSSRHCELTINGDSVVVKDLGSTNGTFIDRAPATEASLTSGQRLQLGSVEMQFISDAPIVTAAPVVRLSMAGASGATATAAAVPAGTSVPSSPATPQVRLRVAAHESAPSPPPAPAPMVADEYSVPVEGPAMCRYHPRSPAAWMCTQCQINYCDLCVATRPGSRTGKFCRRCSAECVARQIQFVPQRAAGGNFFSQLPGAFAFPFKGNGAFMLIIRALGIALVGFVSGLALGIRGAIAIITIRVSIVGYVYAYMQRSIHGTAQGDDKPPDWPDISEFWGDIAVPFLQLATVFVVCFGPTIGMLVWFVGDVLGGGGNPSWKALLVLPLFLAGGVYFPMALLAVAMFDSVAAINPLVVVPAILKAPLEYLAVLAVEFAIFVVLMAKTFLLPLVLPIPIVPNLLTAGIAFYFFMVLVRLLGLLYHAKRQQLGWFSRT